MGGSRRRFFWQISCLFLAGVFLVPAQASGLRQKECSAGLRAISEGTADSDDGAGNSSKNLITSLVRFTAENLNFPTLAQLAEESGLSEREISKALGKQGEWISTILNEKPESYERLRKVFAKEYARIAKEVGIAPNQEQLIQQLNGGKALESFLFGKKALFASFEELDSYSREISEKSFKDVIDRIFLDPERQAALISAVKSRKRLILTTAVAGAPVNEDFLEALKQYAKAKDAEILVFPANMQTAGLAPVLSTADRVHVITHSMSLTPTFGINKIKLLAKHILPLRGLDFIGPRGQSLIVGSPKMHVRTIATVNNSERPHMMFTTGAITDPFYAGRKYIQGRTDEKATHGHAMGALILEWDDEAADYRARHIEYIRDKGFMDREKFYTSHGVESARIEALVLGDVHAGETDGKLWNTLPAVVKTLKPKRTVLHDLFNGASINPHEANKLMTLAEKAEKNELILEEELKLAKQKLIALRAMDPDMEILVVPSNHDLWLEKWLQSGEFMKDSRNRLFGIKLAGCVAAKRYALEYAMVELLGLNDPKIRFLKVGEHYRVGPAGDEVELGLHGHVGASGAKASMASIAKATDRAVYGHTHTYSRENETVNVGTITDLDPSYTRDGFKAWVQSIAAVGENGEIQVHVFKNGAWWATGNKKEVETPVQIVPNVEAFSDEGQVDQYGGQ